MSHNKNSANKSEKIIILGSVFLCGGVLMVLEIIGGRIFAPFFGTSIYIWTSLIGIVLASMSIGYFIGGKLADKGATFERYSLIILIGAAAVAFVAFAKVPILSAISQIPVSLPARGLLGAFILFALPAAVLAMSSPFAVKLMLRTVDNAGAVSGRVSAYYTVGSIIGTFSAGFVLIPLFNNTRIITGLALILAIVAVAVYPQKRKILKSARTINVFVTTVALLIFAQIPLGMPENIVAARDTRYNAVLVYDTIYNDQPTRIMQLGTQWQSGKNLNNNEEFVFEYMASFNLAFHFAENIDRALTIGGAGYSYPQYFVRNHLHAHMDVVEIDAAVTGLAKAHFNLAETMDFAGSRLQIFHEDGRIFLNNNNRKYDAIFNDAFNASSPPFQLLTLETKQHIYNALEDGGVFISNIHAAFEGTNSRILSAYYNTVREVFPQVFLLAPQQRPHNEIQNVIIVALKSDEPQAMTSDSPEMQYLLNQRFTDEVPQINLILTDNHAPVEFLTRHR